MLAPVEKTRPMSAEELEALNAMEAQAGRILASSYDSLGVHAAIGGDFAAAAGYFGRAVQWDPTMNGEDRKWGRAAFAAKDYAQAVAPLGRALGLHPDDGEVRSMLGLSSFITHDYARAVEALQPMEASLDANTPLGLAYFGSAAVAGNSADGLARLKALEAAHPETEEVHRLLGESYAAGKQYGLAVKEFQTALGLAPADVDAKFGLAGVDIALGKKVEAQGLLAELAQLGSKDGEVYFQLGNVQAELGQVKSAVQSLQMAVTLMPANPAYHRELAKALKMNEQPQEAEREARRAEDLQAQNGGHS
jgi:Flp pilus assembly protein TadD